MPFTHYWNRLMAATPGLSNDENRMAISVFNFKVAIARAYAAGRDEARQDIERTAKQVTGNEGIMDVFNGIFGGKP